MLGGVCAWIGAALYRRDDNERLPEWRPAPIFPPPVDGWGFMMDEKTRLHRQFDAIGRMTPASRRVIDPLVSGRLRAFRMPIAFILIVGSFLAILPVFGLWMLPLGLMLLALDVPFLRPFVSGLLIRVRRRIAVWRHRGTN